MFFGGIKISFVWGHHCHLCADLHKMGTIMWLQKYKFFWWRAKSERHFWQFFCKRKRGCYAPLGAKLRVKAKVTSDKWHLKSLIINNLGVTLSLEIFLKLQLTNVNGILLRVTPLGRVFKIHDFFRHYFIGFLTPINYMDKWVTPLGVR